MEIIEQVDWLSATFPNRTWIAAESLLLGDDRGWTHRLFEISHKHLKFIARFLTRHSVKKLNVAGKRESSAPGVGKLVHEALSAALSSVSGD